MDERENNIIYEIKLLSKDLVLRHKSEIIGLTEELMPNIPGGVYTRRLMIWLLSLEMDQPLYMRH